MGNEDNKLCLWQCCMVTKSILWPWGQNHGYTGLIFIGHTPSCDNPHTYKIRKLYDIWSIIWLYSKATLVPTCTQQSAMWLIWTEITTGDLSTDTTEGGLESYYYV